MSTIVPDPTPTQDDPTRFICPDCGKPASQAATRPLGKTLLDVACICANRHLWTVRWGGVV